MVICHEGWRYPRRRAGPPPTASIATPAGTWLAKQPYGEGGILAIDLDLARATGLLAHRYRELSVEGAVGRPVR